MSTRAPLLAEERRLLIAALGRARSHVVVTAVDGDEATNRRCRPRSAPNSPRFPPVAADPDPAPVHAPRVLAPAAVVGRLRAVVCAPPSSRRGVARLCGNAVGPPRRGGCARCSPAQWYGTTALSTDEPLWSGEGHVVTLSPSRLQTLSDCPLRWLLERHGGADGRDVRSALGSLIHALVADPDKGEEQMIAELERH